MRTADTQQRVVRCRCRRCQLVTALMTFITATTRRLLFNTASMSSLLLIDSHPSSPRHLPGKMTMASTKDSSASAGNIVRLYGSAYVECGYCKGGRAIGPSSNPKASSKAYSILAEQLDPALYEQFLYKGWRRSGNALYKPDNWKSCCPALTIRLEANQYTPTKSQRKVLRQMKRLLEPPVHQHQPAKASTNTNTNSSISASTKGATGKHSRCRQERIVQDSGILESLQEWTQQALAEIPILQTNAAAAAAAALPPPVYKVRKQHKTDDHTVILFTTVCAAIAGRSHGAISRNDLAVQLANVLSKRHACVNSTTLMLAQQTDDQHNSKKQRPNAAAVTNHVTIASVVPHMESGQVLVHCVLDDFFSASMLAEPSGDSMVCETAGPAAAQPHSLGAWWASETSATSTPLPPLPDHSPYELTVETVSAHESALDPAVHALYFRYQTVVHNDPDPFTDVNLASASAVAATASSATWATKAPATWLERAQTMLRKEYQHLEGARQRRLFKAFQSFYEVSTEQSRNARMNESAPISTLAHLFGIPNLQNSFWWRIPLQQRAWLKTTSLRRRKSFFQVPITSITDWLVCWLPSAWWTFCQAAFHPCTSFTIPAFHTNSWPWASMPFCVKSSGPNRLDYLTTISAITLRVVQR